MHRYRVTQDQSGASMTFPFYWLARFWAWLFSGTPSSIFSPWDYMNDVRYTCTIIKEDK